jgi:fused signal recognition particle receptor
MAFCSQFRGVATLFQRENMVFFRRTKNEEDNSSEGFVYRLRKGLTKTRSEFSGRLNTLLLGRKEIDEYLLDDLEEILFTSDLGVATTQELIDLVRQGVSRKELDRPDKVKEVLREHIQGFLTVSPRDHRSPDRGEPVVILFIGVNGVGKTTSIGKMAHHFKEEGKSVMLVAADTFRAAAVEQLEIWANRVGADFVRQKEGADPSAVAYDAIAAALARKIDVVLIDTAGRLHTKSNLMDELKKTHRVVGRKQTGAPHEVWLVLDATTGQNAISQAEIFHESLGVTGIILTKLDGTAKGGIVVGITHQLGLPVRYIGIGEKVDDLRPFDPKQFVDAIFE